MNFKTKKASVIDKLFALGVQGVELPPRISKKGKWSEQYEALKKKNKVIIIEEGRDFLSKESFHKIIPHDNVVIDGYFFDYRYYYAVKDQIGDELCFKIPLDEKNEKIAEEMRKCESVAIHIRQGDYKNIPRFQVCGKNYYEKAIKHMIQTLKDPKFYVFSEESVEGLIPEDCQYTHINHNMDD